MPRLQGAVARVLPAIEATVAQACGRADAAARDGARRPRAYVTDAHLRELNGLLSQYPAPPADDRGPEDTDEFALDLVQKINEFASEAAGRA